MGFEQILMALLAGGGLAGNLFGGGGGGQDLSTFEGEQRGDLSLDPRDLLGYGITNTARFGQQWEDIANRGISLPGAYAKATPTFTGGGLPMPIGLMSRDPAHDNPEGHLSLPGIGGNDPWQGLGNLMSGPPGGGGGEQAPPSEGDLATMGSPTRLRQAPGQDMLQQGGDEDEANAALSLLGL